MRDTFQQAVLNWGLPQLRDLPWRRSRDPWQILVSEVMLQQTQVERVIPKWFAFLDAFPDPTQCAAAPLGDVLRLWQGLGYPRRAQNLHRAAQTVVDLGRFPDNLEGLLDLPGVGAYTARAVMAFAFEYDTAVVDTNIARLLARLAGQPLPAREVQRRADDTLPAGESWEWNQCLLDLGAVICRSRAPRCGTCPAARWCSWRGRGPDPAVGSAGVSGRQSRFEGSDRQGRGRLIKRLGVGALRTAEIAAVMGWPEEIERAERIAGSLVAEGLVKSGDGWLRLP